MYSGLKIDECDKTVNILLRVDWIMYATRQQRTPKKMKTNNYLAFVFFLYKSYNCLSSEIRKRIAKDVRDIKKQQSTNEILSLK